MSRIDLLQFSCSKSTVKGLKTDKKMEIEIRPKITSFLITFLDYLDPKTHFKIFFYELNKRKYIWCLHKCGGVKH